MLRNKTLPQVGGVFDNRLLLQHEQWMCVSAFLCAIETDVVIFTSICLTHTLSDSFTRTLAHTNTKTHIHIQDLRTLQSRLPRQKRRRFNRYYMYAAQRVYMKTRF